MMRSLGEWLAVRNQTAQIEKLDREAEQLEAKIKEEEIKLEVARIMEAARRKSNLAPSRLSSNPRLMTARAARARNLTLSLQTKLDLRGRVEQARDAYLLAPTMRGVESAVNVNGLKEGLTQSITNTSTNLAALKELNTEVHTQLDGALVDTQSEEEKAEYELVNRDIEEEQQERVRDMLFAVVETPQALSRKPASRGL